MRSSSWWSSSRRSDSRNTARATEPATANLIAVPDAGGRLAEGLVVEASLVARLFRLRLLAVDASVVISPARAKRRSPAVAARTPPRAIGAGLAAAERCIDEGAASLAASRAIGGATRGPRVTAGAGRSGPFRSGS
jgi:hypothetical protein